MTAIEVYSDYVCPYCFLAMTPLREALARAPGPVTVDWLPFELRPYPTPTLRPEGEYLQSTWARSVYPLADRLGVPIVLPHVSPQPYTGLAFEGHEMARAEGLGDRYTERMFTAFFQDERDIGRIEVLAELAQEIGLDGAALARGLEAGTWRAAHAERLRIAREVRAIRAVPTVIIGEARLEGIASADALLAALGTG